MLRRHHLDEVERVEEGRHYLAKKKGARNRKALDAGFPEMKHRRRHRGAKCRAGGLAACSRHRESEISPKLYVKCAASERARRGSSDEKARKAGGGLMKSCSAVWAIVMIMGKARLKEGGGRGILLPRAVKI